MARLLQHLLSLHNLLLPLARNLHVLRRGAARVLEKLIRLRLRCARTCQLLNKPGLRRNGRLLARKQSTTAYFKSSGLLRPLLLVLATHFMFTLQALYTGLRSVFNTLRLTYTLTLAHKLLLALGAHHACSIQFDLMAAQSLLQRINLLPTLSTALRVALLLIMQLLVLTALRSQATLSLLLA